MSLSKSSSASASVPRTTATSSKYPAGIAEIIGRQKHEAPTGLDRSIREQMERFSFASSGSQRGVPMTDGSPFSSPVLAPIHDGTGDRTGRCLPLLQDIAELRISPRATAANSHHINCLPKPAYRSQQQHAFVMISELVSGVRRIHDGMNETLHRTFHQPALMVPFWIPLKSTLSLLLRLLEHLEIRAPSAKEVNIDWIKQELESPCNKVISEGLALLKLWNAPDFDKVPHTLLRSRSSSNSSSHSPMPLSRTSSSLLSRISISTSRVASLVHTVSRTRVHSCTEKRKTHNTTAAVGAANPAADQCARKMATYNHDTDPSDHNNNNQHQSVIRQERRRRRKKAIHASHSRSNALSLETWRLRARLKSSF